MGIFDRLSRVVRAEVHDLGRRLCPGKGEDEPRVPPTPDAPPGPSERWPKEIRAAYAALELPLGSDLDAVKRAYRQMIQRYHPDRHQQHAERAAVANELTRRLGEARDALEAFLARPT